MLAFGSSCSAATGIVVTPMGSTSATQDGCVACIGVRADWRFAAYIHFCRLFADALQLISFPAEQLERALLTPEENAVFLGQLVGPFLGAKAVDWHNSLTYKLRRQWRDYFSDTGNPLEDVTFFQLSPETRVRQSC